MGSAVRPVRDDIDDIEAALGLPPMSRRRSRSHVSDEAITAIERELATPQATVTAGPITPVGVSGDEIARVSAPAPRTRSTGADVGASALRGLAESGYGTAQGIANLADRLPFIDRAGDIVRGSREEMREFYGDPESGVGKAALIGANIVGSGAQFMVPGAALTRAARVLGTGSKAAVVAARLANPLGPGGAARTVAGRMLGNTALNTPLNLAVSQSPEDNTAGFVGEVTDSDALRAAARNPAAAFAIETAADLTGNALFEGVGVGAKRLMAESAASPGFITAPGRTAPRKPVDALAPTRFVAPPAGTEAIEAIEKELDITPTPPERAAAPPEPPARVPDELDPDAAAERAAIEAEAREEESAAGRDQSLRDEKGGPRRNLSNVPSDALEAELDRINQVEAEEESSIGHRQLPEYVAWQNLPGNEKIGRSGRNADEFGNKIKRQAEDLPDAGGDLDSDTLDAWRKADTAYNRGRMAREARARWKLRIESELDGRGVLVGDGGTPFGSPRKARGDDLSLFAADDLFGKPGTMADTDVGAGAARTVASESPEARANTLESHAKSHDVAARQARRIKNESDAIDHEKTAARFRAEASQLRGGAIPAAEMAARRDELGFERSASEATATPDQGALFSPAPDDAPARPRPKVTAEEMLAVGRQRIAEIEQELGLSASPDLTPAMEREGRMFADLPSSMEAPVSSATAAPATSAGVPAPRLTPQSRAQMAGLSRELTTELAASAVGAGVGATAAPAEDREWGALFGAVGGFAGARGALAFGKSRATLRALREDAKPLIQISRSLAAAVGVPLRQGRFLSAQRQASGVFFPHKEVTRIVRYDAVGTASHEVGHYISKKYLLNPTMKGAGPRGASGVPSTVQRELIDAGKRLYGNRKPQGGYGEEGIAEFFKYSVIDSPSLARDFPTATPWFRTLLEKEPALTAAIEQARVDFERYKASPANARIAAMLSVDERVRNMPTLTDYQRAAVDDLVDIQKAVAQLTKHGATPTARDAYTLARVTRGAAGAADEMMERGIEIGGKRVTEGLAPALRSVPAHEMQAFREYMVAERAVELAARGVDSGVDLRSAQQTVARDAARFADAARAVWAHSAALIDLRVEAGLLTPDEGTHIKNQNKKRVPFYREFAPDEQGGGSGMGGRSMTRNSSGIYRIKGSARKIIDPLESLVADTYKTVRQAREHAAASTLIKTALKTEGGGRIAELVPTPQTQTSFRVDRKTVEQMMDLGMIDENTAEEILSGMMTGDIAGRLSGFTDARMAGGAERKDMVIPVILNGERKWVQIGDADLFRTLQGMNQEELSSWQRALSTPTRTLRAGATLTLGFITRNPLRDLGTAFVRTRAGRMVAPGEHMVRGVFSLLKRDESYQTWRLSGGDNATMLGLDRVTTQKHLKDLRATAVEKGWNLVTKPIDTLRLLSSISENATRLGEFKLVYKRAIREGMSVADARTTAAYAARDVSTDFAKAGTIGRQVNLIVEFVNATVQGDVNFFTDLRERPATVVPRAMALVTIPSVALYLAQRDDPVYQNVPQWAKDVGWVVVWPPRAVRAATGMPDAEASVAIIPKPFEWGVAFGTVPEKLAQYLGEGDPHALRQAADALVRGFAPNFIPTAIKPFIENFANESFFRRRPIVPRGREGEDAWAQAGPRTGETARVIGRVANLSPAKIENVVSGYTGGLGKTVLQGTDKIVRMGREMMGKEPLRPVMPTDREGIYGAPVLSAFLRPSPGMEAESIQRFYELSDRAERRRQTYKGLLADGRTGEAMAYFRKHQDEILAMGAQTDVGTGPMRDVRQQITELRQLWGDVSRSPMAKAEKRRTVANIEQSIIALSRQGVAAGRARGTTPTRQARAAP